MDSRTVKQPGADAPTDEDLFRRMTLEDAGALKLLFERYYTPLCRFSRSFVADAETAEEAVSDVFVRLWLHRSRLSLRSALKPYLYAAVRNESLNRRRSSLGIVTECFDDDAPESMDRSFEADLPLRSEEAKAGIDRLLECLPPRRRLVFRMSRLDGLSYQEIADILSISIHTVQHQMVEAVKSLSRLRISQPGGGEISEE